MKLLVSWAYYVSNREELDNLIRDPDDNIIKAPDDFFDMIPREYLLIDDGALIATKEWSDSFDKIMDKSPVTSEDLDGGGIIYRKQFNIPPLPHNFL
jgi:hypothetical protein